MPVQPDLDAVLHQNRSQHLKSLEDLLRIPSISADPSRGDDMTAAAKWLVDRFRNMGLDVELINGDGPPLVFASSPPVSGAPIVLVYGHYDVQPPDPLNLWVSPPFEPTIRDGKIYARGATDDKGQMLTHVLAVETLLQQTGRLPLQLKFLIEGQEECGSEVLEAKLLEIADRLACDCMVISDSSQFRPGQPAITYGLRGIAYFELHIDGPAVDLHSGVFGGAVANPAIALCQLISEIKGPDGRITLPNFYDAVLPLTDRERDAWRQLDFDESAFASQIGVDRLDGEEGYSTLERRWARPSFDVHGLSGGYQGPGGKTVLPATASAKLSFRLVPDQTPEAVASQLKAFIDDKLPRGVRYRLIDLHGGPGVVVDPNSPYVAAASQAIEQAWGKRPVLIREGGSIPIVAQMVEQLDCHCMLLGWGLDDDGAHSPNEKFAVEDFHRGIAASAGLWQILGSMSKTG